MSVRTNPISRKKKFVRARRPDEIELRRAAILNATKDLLDTTTIADLSLSAIAKKAKLSTSNLYRYFDSREEILIMLMLNEQERLTSLLERRTRDLKVGDIGALAKEMARTVMSSSLYSQLTGSMSVFYHSRVSANALNTWQIKGYAHGMRSTAVVKKVIPRLSDSEIMDALNFMATLISGLEHFAKVGELFQSRVDGPMPVELGSLEQRLAKALLFYLNGLIGQKNASRSATK